MSNDVQRNPTLIPFGTASVLLPSAGAWGPKGPKFNVVFLIKKLFFVKKRSLLTCSRGDGFAAPQQIMVFFVGDQSFRARVLKFIFLVHKNYFQIFGRKILDLYFAPLLRDSTLKFTR